MRLENMTPDGVWEFRLPTLNVPVHAIRDTGPVRLDLRVDTVRILPEQRCVVMCQRAVVPAATDERELVLGHMTPAWLKARCGRRRYVDFGGTRGERRHGGYFT